jgi:hypothetical protein
MSLELMTLALAVIPLLIGLIDGIIAIWHRYREWRYSGKIVFPPKETLAVFHGKPDEIPY